MKLDFDKMGKEGREYLNKCPKRKASKEAYMTKKRRKDGSVADSQRQVAAIINGVMQATRHENDSIAASSIPSHVGGRNTSAVRMPQHGTHTRRGSNNISQASTSQRQQLQFDHNGDIVQQE